MKTVFIILLTSLLLNANPFELTSFEADFKQTITDDKGKTIVYSGHILAKKPQNALWIYKQPVEKKVYINNHKVTIIEPELEQVIIKYLDSESDFFSMLKDAKKLNKNKYTTNFKDTIFVIEVSNDKIKTISYLDQFDNKIKITFTQIQQNKNIDSSTFRAVFPLDYDIIQN